MSDKNLVVFVDNIGRTIVGEDVNSDDNAWTIKNPSIVHVQPNPQTGQMTVQLIPFFFKMGKDLINVRAPLSAINRPK